MSKKKEIKYGINQNANSNLNVHNKKIMTKFLQIKINQIPNTSIQSKKKKKLKKLKDLQIIFL